MCNTINRMNDYAFKRIFGARENEDLLISFCDSVLSKEPGCDIARLDLQEHELDPEVIANKESRLDILAKMENGAYINLENLAYPVEEMRKRALYYWSKLYVAINKGGDPNRDPYPVISILVLDYKEFPGDNYHSSFHIACDNDPFRVSNDMAFHFLELPKIRVRKEPPVTMLEKWLVYLCNTEGEIMEKIAQEEPIIAKALAFEQIFKTQPRERQLYELREKVLTSSPV